MTMEEIHALCQDATIEITAHMLQRLQKRRIRYSEVKEVLLNRRIIEDYPDDYPYPSCLVFGYTVNNRILHVVAGIGEGRLWLVTAYEPSSEEWESGFEKRKERR